MFSVLPAGNFRLWGLWIFFFITNFPTPSVLLPFGDKGEINAKQATPTIILPEPFDTSLWLTPLFILMLTIVPLTLDLCWLFETLAERPSPRLVIPLRSPSISQDGQQREALVLLERRPDIKPAVALAEPENLVDSIRRHSQDSKVETMPEASGPPTPRTPSSITSSQTLPFQLHTAASPAVGSPFALSVTPTAQNVNDLCEPSVHSTTTYPFIFSPTSSPSSSPIDSNLSYISRRPSYIPGDECSLHSPALSIRPPTYRTCASEATISTLPLYQENEDDRSSRVSSRHSTFATRARRDRQASRPPLLLPSFPIRTP